MKDARLEYAFQLGSSHRTAETTFRLSDGRWHNITVLRRGSFALLWVDDLPFPVAVQADIAPPSDPVLGDLFVGKCCARLFRSTVPKFFLEYQ